VNVGMKILRVFSHQKLVPPVVDRQAFMLTYWTCGCLPAAIVTAGIVFNMSVCLCLCVSTNQKVVLETYFVAWTTNGVARI